LIFRLFTPKHRITPMSSKHKNGVSKKRALARWLLELARHAAPRAHKIGVA